MRLTQKKIEEILIFIVGEQGLPLVRELVGKENVSEFDLAKRTKFDIKVVRRLLYLLYNHNLICFTRKKDKQKGWYIYYWTLINENIRFNYFKMRRSLLERLKKQLEQEERELFFICPKGCSRLNFDHATDFEFHCPECGDLLNQDDSKDKILDLKKRIISTQEEVTKLLDQKRVREEKAKARTLLIKEKEKKKADKAKKLVKKKVVKKKVVKKKVAKKKKAKSTKGTKKKVVKGKKSAKKKVVKKKVAKKKKTAAKKKVKSKTKKKATKGKKILKKSKKK